MIRIGTVVVLLVSWTASAQNVPLQALLDSADKSNIDRQIVSEQFARARAEYRQAWSSLLPSLSVQGSWTRNQFPVTFTLPFGPTPTELTLVPKDQLDGVARVDLPLIDTTRWMRAGAAGAAEDAAGAREELTQDAIRRQVAAMYYSYAGALAVKQSAKRSADVADAQAKLMKVRLDAGAVTELEQLRSNAEVQRTGQTVTDMEVVVATTRRALHTMTGMDPGENVTFPNDDLSAEGNAEQLMERTEGLPAVRAAEFDAKSAGRMATASKLAVVPMVGAQFTERISNATGFSGQPEQYNFGVTLGWRLDVPTFMGMGAASAGARVADLVAERARLQARDQIFNDWQKLNAALKKNQAAMAQVEAARRAAEVARNRFDVGAATQVDLIQAERDLFGAEVGRYQARADLGSARASLRISAGLPVLKQ